MNYLYLGILLNVALLIFILAPSIVWIVVGSLNMDEDCGDTSDSILPDLPTWLVVQGSVGILYFALVILILFSSMCGKLNHGLKTLCEIGVTADTLLIVCLFLFEMAWLIMGSVRLSEDAICQEENALLYNTSLASVILGFLGISMGFFPVPVLK